MKTFITDSLFFGSVISITAYEIGIFIRKKTGLAILNPLLIAIILVIACLLFFGIDYDVYNDSAKYISYFLTPATVCLAIPLYRSLSLLRRNWQAVLIGISAGSMASMGVILLLSHLFGLSHEQYVTLLPKSVTTAVGMGVSEELNGIVNITVAAIIVTGIIGSVLADFVLRIFHIEEPAARGIALGSSAHAVGTAKAFELGEEEGAMGSLAIVISGMITVVFASFFAGLL